MAKGETYEEFVAKFKNKKDNPKTTDDCYTPKEVWEIIESFVYKEYGVKREDIIRPFYPGGDYEKEDYSSGVVVDNPPFSIFSKIMGFYEKNNTKYFLFCDGKTWAKYINENNCVLLPRDILKFENGAKVRCAFITNLENEYAIKRFEYFDERYKKERKEKRKHEENIYSGLQFNRLVKEIGNFKHDEIEFVKKDKYGPLYGGGFKIKK